MLENLLGMLCPLGTVKGGKNAAVSDDAGNEQQSQDRPERGLHFKTSGNCNFIWIHDQKRRFDRTQGPQKIEAP